MTDLAALTARAETAVTALLIDGNDDKAALIRDLLTYATTVTQERDTAIFNAEATRQGAGAADTIFRREIAKLRARVEHAEQERDAAIASAHTAYHRLQHVDPPHSLLGRRCFACPGTIVAACNRCGQKYATPIAQETP